MHIDRLHKTFDDYLLKKLTVSNWGSGKSLQAYREYGNGLEDFVFVSSQPRHSEFFMGGKVISSLPNSKWEGQNLGQLTFRSEAGSKFVPNWGVSVVNSKSIEYSQGIDLRSAYNEFMETLGPENFARSMNYVKQRGGYLDPVKAGNLTFRSGAHVGILDVDRKLIEKNPEAGMFRHMLNFFSSTNLVSIRQMDNFRDRLIEELESGRALEPIPYKKDINITFRTDEVKPSEGIALLHEVKSAYKIKAYDTYKSI